MATSTAQRQQQRQRQALDTLQEIQQVAQATQDPELIEAVEVLELTEQAVQDGHPAAVAEVLKVAEASMQGTPPGWADLTPEKTGTAKRISQVAGAFDIASLIAEIPRIVNWTVNRAPTVLKKAGPAVARWAARKAAIAGTGALAGSFVAPGPGTFAVAGGATLASLGYDIYKIGRWVLSAKKADPAKVRYLAETATRNAQRISRRFGTPSEVAGGVLHGVAGTMAGDPWEAGFGAGQAVLGGGPAAVRGVGRMFRQAPPTGAAPTGAAPTPDAPPAARPTPETTQIRQEAAADLAEGRRLTAVEHAPQAQWLQAHADEILARARKLGMGEEAFVREALERVGEETSSRGPLHQALKQIWEAGKTQPAAGRAPKGPTPGSEAYYRQRGMHEKADEVLDAGAERAQAASVDDHYELLQYEDELRKKFPNISEAQLQRNLDAYRAGDQKALDFYESLRRQREAPSEKGFWAAGRRDDPAAKPRVPSPLVPKPAWFPKGTTKAGREFKKQYMVDSGLNAKEAAADLRKISQGKADQALVDKVKETYDLVLEQRTPAGVRATPGAREEVVDVTTQLEDIVQPSAVRATTAAGFEVPKKIQIDDPSGIVDSKTGLVQKISVPNPALTETAEEAALRSAQAQEGVAARAAEDAAVARGESVEIPSSELSGTPTPGGPQALPRQSAMGPKIGAEGAYADWLESITDQDMNHWFGKLKERGYGEAEWERFRKAAFDMQAAAKKGMQGGRAFDAGVYQKRLRDFIDKQKAFLHPQTLRAEAAKSGDASAKHMMRVLGGDPEKFQRVMLQTRQRMESIMQNIRLQTPEMAAREGATQKFFPADVWGGLQSAYDPVSQSRILDKVFALKDVATEAKPFKEPIANLLFRMTYIAEEMADFRMQMRMLSGIDPALVKTMGYDPTKFTRGGLNEPLRSAGENSLAMTFNAVQRTVEDMVGMRMQTIISQPQFGIGGPRVVGVAKAGTKAGVSTGPGTIPKRRARSAEHPGATQKGDEVLAQYGRVEPAPLTELPQLSPKTLEELEKAVEDAVRHYEDVFTYAQEINDGKTTLFAGLDPTLLKKLGVRGFGGMGGGAYGFQRGEEFGRERGYGPAGQRGAGIVGMGIGAAGGYGLGPVFKGVWQKGAPVAINLQNALRFNLLSGVTSASKAALGAHSGGYKLAIERGTTGVLKQLDAIRARMGGASKVEVAPLMQEATELRNSGFRIFRDMAKIEYDFFTKGDELVKQTFHIDTSTKAGALEFERLMQAAGIDTSLDEYIALERMGGALTENWLGRAFRAADFPVITALMKNGVDFNAARQATLTGRFRTKAGEEIFNWLGGNRTQLAEIELSALRKAQRTAPTAAGSDKIRELEKSVKGHLPWFDLAATAAAPIFRVGAHGAEQALRHTVAPAARLAGSKAKWLDELAPAGDTAGNVVRLGMGAGATAGAVGVGAYGNPRLESMLTAAAGPLMVPAAVGIGIGKSLREGASPFEAALTTAGSTWDAISPFSPELFTREGFPGTVGRYTSPAFYRQLWGGMDPHRRSTAQTDIQRGVAEGTISPNVSRYLSPVTGPFIQSTPYSNILPQRSPSGTIDSVSGMSAAPRYINLNPASENFAFNRPWLGEGLWGQPGMGGAEASEARLRELRGPDFPNLPPTEGRHSKFDHPVGKRSALFDKLPEAVRGGAELVRSALDKAFFPETPSSRVVGAGVNEAAQLLATSGYLDEEGLQEVGVSLGSPRSVPPSGTMTTTAQPNVAAPHPLGTSAPVGGMTPRTEELVRVTRGRKNAQVQQMLDRVSREDPAYFNTLKTNPAQFRYWLEWADKRAEHSLQPWSETDLLNEVRRQGATVPLR